MRRQVWLVAACVALGVGLLLLPGTGPDAPPEPAPPDPVAGAASSSAGSSTAVPPPASPTPASGAASPDVDAGLLSRDVPPVGTGTTQVVPGSAPAPGPGRVRTVRVEVEGGLPVDAPAFAGFVMDTLNDPRGWGADGTMSFARTDGEAEVAVVLASPETSARMCRPLDTRGTLSCRNGPHVILTHHRWVLAHPDYGDDRTGYRRYVVNHEVGHFLGHGHVPCPGAGVAAPVMMQQTKGLLGCAPNPWPRP